MSVLAFLRPLYTMTAYQRLQWAQHVQAVLFYTAPGSQMTTVGNAFYLGEWRAGQQEPRAVLVKRLSLPDKHMAFRASSRLELQALFAWTKS